MNDGKLKINTFNAILCFIMGDVFFSVSFDNCLLIDNNNNGNGPRMEKYCLLSEPQKKKKLVSENENLTRIPHTT